MVSHVVEMKVRWSEADPAGIVFYPRFFEWFDLATEALFESLGLPWAEIFPKYRVVGVPIMESSARFRSPVRRRLRGARLGRVPRRAQCTACSQALSGRGRDAPERPRRHLRMKPAVGTLAGVYLSSHTPRYCTLEAAVLGKLASDVFRPVRDGLVAQGKEVAKARLDVMVVNSCHLITTFPTDRKSTRLNSSHIQKSRMPSSA